MLLASAEAADIVLATSNFQKCPAGVPVSGRHHFREHCFRGLLAARMQPDGWTSTKRQRQTIRRKGAAKSDSANNFGSRLLIDLVGWYGNGMKRGH